MTEIKLNINELYLDWLKKHQVEDSQVNFVIFICNLNETPDWFYDGEHQFEFKIHRDENTFGFVTMYWQESWDSPGSWYIEDMQRQDFNTLEELIDSVNKTDVIIWKH